MKINLDIIINIYKKTFIITLLLGIISFLVLFFQKSFFPSISFAVGMFVIALNILGIYLIAQFSKGHGNEINKDRVVFSLLLFTGKLILILVLIFVLLVFKIVEPKFFMLGLSLGFLIFFIANIIFVPLKIYKLEKQT